MQICPFLSLFDILKILDFFAPSQLVYKSHCGGISKYSNFFVLFVTKIMKNGEFIFLIIIQLIPILHRYSEINVLDVTCQSQPEVNSRLLETPLISFNPYWIISQLINPPWCGDASRTPIKQLTLLWITLVMNSSQISAWQTSLCQPRKQRRYLKKIKNQQNNSF